jgi:hypothetical protein
MVMSVPNARAIIVWMEPVQAVATGTHLPGIVGTNGAKH